MEPDTEMLLREFNERRWRHDEFDSPHERAWHVSFHASQFPGDEANACKRYLLYRMMNLPANEPMPPWVTTTGDVGKAGELTIARAWYEGGKALAIPEDGASPGIHQLGFVDRSVWLTGSVDLPILKPGWRRPHIVEIKGKADEVLEEMLKGRWDTALTRMVPRPPDPGHILQLKASLGLAHEHDWGEVTVCSSCWRIFFADIFEALHPDRLPVGTLNPVIGIHHLELPLGKGPRLRSCPWCGSASSKTFHLEPPTTGEIYYWSRSWPRKTKSFFYEHDPAYMERGRRILAEAREHFINNELPPKPEHFQWSLGPCGNCSMKPHCRLDSGLAPRKRKPVEEDIVTALHESNGVRWAKAVRPHYDFAAVHSAVLREWDHG